MSALFSPLTIRQLTLRNRVVMPPMVCAVMPALNTRADAQGCVTTSILNHYACRAHAGAGMIIVEATAVDAGGRCWAGGLNAYDDLHLPGLRQLANRLHAEGAAANIQLVHGGPQASEELSGGKVMPDALSEEQILAIEERFADAAARCVAAGFDAVEIHGAHGFLLDSFLSPQRNTRTDGYGGTLAGRMRMLLETCRRVKARIGEQALLDCRISIFNHLAEGFSAEDFHQLVRVLAETGIDLLHLSVMNGSALDGYFGNTKSLGQWAKEVTTLPIILAGRLGDPRNADRAIADHHADLAAIGSAMLKDPEWTQHAQQILG